MLGVTCFLNNGQLVFNLKRDDAGIQFSVLDSTHHTTVSIFMDPRRNGKSLDFIGAVASIVVVWVSS